MFTDKEYTIQCAEFLQEAGVLSVFHPWLIIVKDFLGHNQ
jgi:hypothetical protein